MVFLAGCGAATTPSSERSGIGSLAKHRHHAHNLTATESASHFSSRRLIRNGTWAREDLWRNPGSRGKFFHAPVARNRVSLLDLPHARLRVVQFVNRTLGVTGDGYRIVEVGAQCRQTIAVVP